ncbi:MAG TPA: hypothetical protein VHG89_11350 [Verrucomicrobiae bacterium]|nr:hypothetical protein [Verrucomicrobiae bacterium]
MSDARDKRAAEIQDAIRQILRCDWNPIGFDVPLDEYDSYIGSVYRILASSRSEEELIKFLDWTEQNTIGMPNNSREKLRPIAQKLLALNVKL